MSDMSDAPQTASSQARTWEMLCHLTALAGFIIPFGNLLGPLVIWLIKKNEIPSVDAHGKESLNFQISILIYAIISGILVLVLIGFVLLCAVGLMSLICVIIASVKASNGVPYRYPLTIRFLQ